MSEHPFDVVSKALANCVSRRMALLGILQSVVIGLLSGRPGAALADVPSHANFTSLFGKPGVTCTGGSQVLISHSSDGSVGSVRPVCVYDTKCAKTGNAAPDRFLIGCHSVDGLCPDFADCAKEFIESEKDIFRLFQARPFKGATSNKRQFGAACRYDWTTPIALYRRKLDNEKWDVMCATPVTGCDMPPELKGSFLAVCDGPGFTKEGAYSYLVCPSAADCLAKPIAAVPARTVSEAKKVAR